MEKHTYKRNLLNVLFSDVPGVRAYVGLFLLVMALFLSTVIFSAYLFVKIIQLGAYADIVLAHRTHIIVLIWGGLALILSVYALRAILILSWKIAGPIRRIERELDGVIAGSNAVIVARGEDALSGITKRINTLIELRIKQGKV